MSATKFTKLYGEFLNDLKRVFPDKVVGDVEIGMKTGMQFFIKNCLPYMTYISGTDVDWLVSHDGGRLMLIDGVSFAEIFGDDRCNDATSNIIWTYLHSLYVLLLGVDRAVIDEVVKDEDEDSEVVNGIKECFELQKDILKNIKQFRDDQKQAEEANRLAEEFEKEQVAKSKKDKKNKKAVKKSGSEGGTTGNEGSEDGDSNPFFTDEGNKFLENSMIGSLAKELQQEIDVNDLPNVENPSDIMNMFSGGDGGKMMGAFGKVMGKMTQKMESGQINNQALMGEVMQMATMMTGAGGGGGSGSNPMMDMMSGLMGGAGGNGGGSGSNPLMNMMSTMMGGDDSDNEKRHRRNRKNRRRGKKRDAVLKAKKMKKKAERKSNKAHDGIASGADEGKVKQLDGLLSGMSDEQTLTAGQIRAMLSGAGAGAGSDFQVSNAMLKKDEETNENIGENVGDNVEDKQVAETVEAEGTDDDFGTEDSDGSDDE